MQMKEIGKNHSCVCILFPLKICKYIRVICYELPELSHTHIPVGRPKITKNVFHKSSIGGQALWQRITRRSSVRQHGRH